MPFARAHFRYAILLLPWVLFGCYFGWRWRDDPVGHAVRSAPGLAILVGILVLPSIPVVRRWKERQAERNRDSLHLAGERGSAIGASAGNALRRALRL